ncbi:MAG: hypothetical protein HY420_02360 [Candidatus Kerfeldbacteria bacterium]|nr:hypothetical protein [Candidatus Kerfeldbacteria bacterium]
MIVSVAPLLRLPRTVDVFDYRITRRAMVQTGSVVLVRFRQKRLLGIVLGQVKHSTVPFERLRDIEGIISEVSLLPGPQLQALMAVARDSFTSVSTALRSVIPYFPLNANLKLTSLAADRPEPRLRPELDRETNSPIRTTIVAYLKDQTKLAWYRSLGTMVTRASASLLVLTPTIERAQRLQRFFPKSILYHQRLSATQRRAAFLNIRQQPGALVIGTRSAVFAPVQRLGLIIIDDEHADAHVQEEPSPRYDDRAVAELLARASGAKLILTSRLPSLLSTARHPVSRHLDRHQPGRLEFLDLELARRSGDFNIITEAARGAITKCLQQGNRVVIIHHRRTLYGSLECQDCGYVPTCQTCSVPMADEGAVLKCRHCGTESAIPRSCPRCRGTLKGRGRGIPHVRRELLALPGLSPHDLTKTSVIIPSESDELESDVFSLALITRLDSLMSVPRADAEERLRRLLITLLGKLPTNGTLLVQGSARLRAVTASLFDESWRRDARIMRQRFGYPPALQLLLLRRRADARSRGLTPEELVLALRRHSAEVTAVGPFPSRGRSRLDRGGSAIVLRYNQNLPDPIKSILRSLDEGWTITHNPVELR